MVGGTYGRVVARDDRILVERRGDHVGRPKKLPSDYLSINFDLPGPTDWEEIGSRVIPSLTGSLCSAKFAPVGRILGGMDEQIWGRMIPLPICSSNRLQ